jgi:hypothetical protein
MNNFKNLLIAVLTGLLALSLFTQPAQSAPTSTSAKAIEYAQCLNMDLPDEVVGTLVLAINEAKKVCAIFRP